MTRLPTQVGKPGLNPRGRRTLLVDGFERVELPEVSPGAVVAAAKRAHGGGLGGRGPVSFRRVGGRAAGGPGGRRGGIDER